MVTNWGTNPLLDSFLETTDNNNTGTESDGKLSLARTLCIVASFCCFILGVVFLANNPKSGSSSYGWDYGCYSHKQNCENIAIFIKFLLAAGWFVACACLFHELGAAVRRLAGAKVTSSPACGVMRVISYLGVFVCLICGCYVLFWLDKEDFEEYFVTGVLRNLSLFQIASLRESGIDLATLKILVGLGFIFVAVPCWCAAQFFRGLSIVIGAIDSGTLSVTDADEGSRDWSFEIAKARADKAKAEATIQRLNDKIAELGRKEKELNAMMVPIAGKDFSMLKCEVTQAIWEEFMSGNPSAHPGADLPVENVSLDDCRRFLKVLNSLQSVSESGRPYRLPTAEEWDFGCRAGATEEYSKLSDGFGISTDAIGDVAWIASNSKGTTHPVGQKPPNAFGLHDMIGNVWEWTSTAENGEVAIRGGGWDYIAQDGELPKSSVSPGNRSDRLGFRLVR